MAMNTPKKLNNHEFYTKCDERRESKCISVLEKFIVELIRYHAQLAGHMKEWVPRLDQLTILAMKLRILANNKQTGFVIYDEYAADNVIAEFYAHQKQIFDELQGNLAAIADAYAKLRIVYDALQESTIGIDWRVNSPFITGDLHLVPFASLLDEARNIMFYFKIFHENLEDKFKCMEIQRTDSTCVKKLLENSRMSEAFLKSFNDFLTASRKQCDCFNQRNNKSNNDIQ